MEFINVITKELLTHQEFIKFVWEESERQFNELHEDENWCNLNQGEQLAIYCEQYEHQLADNHWQLIR